MDIPRLKIRQPGFSSALSMSEYKEYVERIERSNAWKKRINKLLDIIDKPDKEIVTKTLQDIYDKKIEILDIPRNLMKNTLFVESLIKDNVERIDEIVSHCPQKTLQNETINDLVSKIQRANTEDFEKENVRELKSKKVEKNNLEY